MSNDRFYMTPAHLDAMERTQTQDALERYEMLLNNNKLGAIEDGAIHIRDILENMIDNEIAKVFIWKETLSLEFLSEQDKIDAEDLGYKSDCPFDSIPYYLKDLIIEKGLSDEDFALDVNDKINSLEIYL